MFIKLIKETLIFIIFGVLMLKIIKTQHNCLVLQSSNSFGGSRPGSCFEYKTTDLKQMIIYTQTTLVGFTFILNNGSTKSYIESLANLNNFTITFTTIDIIGINIYIENEVQGLQFHLHDWNSNIKYLSKKNGSIKWLFLLFEFNFYEYSI